MSGDPAQWERAVEPGEAGSESGPDAARTTGVDEALKTRAMDEAPVGITIANATDPEMPLVYANAAFERITGYPTSYAVGRNCRFLQGAATREKPVDRMRAAIESGTAVAVELRNYRQDGTLFWNEVTLAPLRDDAGEVVYYVGFQQDVTRRKRAERAVRRHAERIETERAAQKRLLDRLDGVIADVTAAVMRAHTRADLACGVIATLASTYAGAWIGTYDPATEAVLPRVIGGTTHGDVAERTFPVGSETDPTGTAVSAALRDRSVRIESLAADAAGVTAVAAVPVYFGDVRYGAICVYAGGTDEFADHESDVFSAMGRTVATGVNALESQRTLRATETVELRFGLLDDHPLAELTSQLDCRAAYVESVGDRDRPTDLFEFDAAAEWVRSGIEECDLDLHAVVVAGDEECLTELSVPDPAFRSLLADHGAELRAATFGPKTGEVAIEVGRESLARSLADELLDRFDHADLLGYRRRQRQPESHREFAAGLQDDLTDRQHAALVRAYSAGYFEWPHEATGEDIAVSMGVSRSTFHQHLRTALRKLVGAVLDQGAGVDADASSN